MHRFPKFYYLWKWLFSPHLLFFVWFHPAVHLSFQLSAYTNHDPYDHLCNHHRVSAFPRSTVGSVFAILQYWSLYIHIAEDTQQHISDVDVSVKAADQRIEEISEELGTQRLIQKHCDSYRLCRKVIEDCKSAKNPKAYRTKHQAEYQLHDSLKKELQDLGVTKIPSSKKIQKRIENLESKQAATVRRNKNYWKSKRL